MIRMLKLVLISVVILFLILTAISSLLPSKVRISRAIDIRAPMSVIRAEVSNLSTWEHWNAYVSNMKEKSTSADSIDGERLDIKMISNEPSLVLTRWKQPDGKEFIGGFHFIPQKSVTTVQWSFDFKFKWYPWEKFSSMVYDQQLGPAMQESLENLKRISENVR